MLALGCWRWRFNSCYFNQPKVVLIRLLVNYWYDALCQPEFSEIVVNPSLVGTVLDICHSNQSYSLVIVTLFGRGQKQFHYSHLFFCPRTLREAARQTIYTLGVCLVTVRQCGISGCFHVSKNHMSRRTKLNR